MKTAYINKLRVRLQRRMQEVMKADYQRFGQCLQHFFAQVRADKVLAEILRTIESSRPADQGEYVDSLRNHGAVLCEPSDPMVRASLFLELCTHVVEHGPSRSMQLMKSCNPSAQRFPETVESFRDQVFEPLYTFFDKRLDDGDYLLALILQYKRYVEWFSHEDLEQKMARLKPDHKAKDWPEDLVDEHLRRFLMEQGVDWPFSRPKTREGEVDIIVPQGTKCLPLEVKVYDGAGRTQAHLRHGFHQAVQYADDYQSAFGYYVIFNVSSRPLTIGTETAEGFSRISDRNHDIFCVCVQVSDLGPPSKRRDLKSVQIPETDLIEQSEMTTELNDQEDE